MRTAETCSPPSVVIEDEAVLERYPGVFAILGIAPGVQCFILRLPGDRLASEDGGVVRSARLTGSRETTEELPLAAITGYYYRLGGPPVDRAKIDVLNLVVTFCPLDNPHRLILPLFCHPVTPLRFEYAARP
jgi:hypothetical protein